MCAKFKLISNIFLILIFFVSCGSKEKKLQENSSRIILTAKVIEDDKFQLFYIDSANGKYNERDVVSVNVEGSQDFQSIVFKLPLKALPKQFRIDIGENKIESPVEIDTLKIVFGSKKLVMNNMTFNRFFKHNVYIEENEHGIYSRRIINKKYDPFFSSTKFLKKHLELKF
ncbi:hypothetical protein [Maribacter arcticus]|uniref:Lipoprotein n=1 Tax=Maribacter arcticus TaxID=561365 RepID=A0A1T5BUP5_9FLAO|nr:hypothetical protein [Maribacter arcticus]SKB50851.1 hypothetical protein SAMN05660866_01814 [Maribacter arcticus]